MGGVQGGASNISKVIRVLKDLGYKKIAAIYDGDKKKDYDETKELFNDVHFEIIETEDIRDKVICENEKKGMLNHKFEVKKEYENNIRQMFIRIYKFLGN